jgi:MFS family permease
LTEAAEEDAGRSRAPLGEPTGEELTAPTSQAARPGLRQAFNALGTRAFRWWFFSQVLSASGTMTQGVAQSWIVLRLTGSGVDLGLVTACTFGPLLFVGAWAGALVDRLDRRRLLLTTQGCLLSVSAVLGALTLLGTIRVWMVFVGAFAAGCVNTIDQPARQVFVLELVGRRRTANAVSLNEVVINASRVLGPAAGGALLATTGARSPTSHRSSCSRASTPGNGPG